MLTAWKVEEGRLLAEYRRRVELSLYVKGPAGVYGICDEIAEHRKQASDAERQYHLEHECRDPRTCAWPVEGR